MRQEAGARYGRGHSGEASHRQRRPKSGQSANPNTINARALGSGTGEVLTLSVYPVESCAGSKDIVGSSDAEHVPLVTAKQSA